MEIFPLGHASFKLKGKAAVVVTDPYDPDMVGLKFPKHTLADVVTVSHAHPDHNFINAVDQGETEMVVISGPGEYEVKGVDILGIAAFHDPNGGKDRGKNTLYRIDIDGISVVHLGDLGHKLTEEQEAAVGSVDVLFIPVGGFYTIDAKMAVEVVTALEPAIVVPMHYQRAELDPQVFQGLASVSLFLKEMGKEGLMPQPKLKVTKDTIPEETQVVVLE